MRARDRTKAVKQPEPDPIKHFAGVRALLVLKAFDLDPDLVHVIEAIEEYERVNPSLPAIRAMLPLVRQALRKRQGKPSREAHRNLAIIAYAYELQWLRSAIAPGGKLADLKSEELDLIAKRHAQIGVPLKQRKRQISRVISRYRNAAPTKWVEKAPPGAKKHKLR